MYQSASKRLIEAPPLLFKHGAPACSPITVDMQFPRSAPTSLWSATAWTTTACSGRCRTLACSRLTL